MKTPSSLRSRGAALIAAALCFVAGRGAAQPNPIVPNLADAPSERGWKLINRAAILMEKDGAEAIHLEGTGGTGFVRLENVAFAAF